MVDLARGHSYFIFYIGVDYGTPDDNMRARYCAGWECGKKKKKDSKKELEEMQVVI